MPEQEPPPGRREPLDVRTIRNLVRLMKAYDLTALDVVEGPTRIRLRRQGVYLPGTPAPLPAAPGPATVAPLPSAPSPATTPPAPAGVFIESPMVGTYYSASSPDSAPFVSVGLAVRPETTVCVIEAMKVFTEIPAGVAGTVAEVLVKNGQPVEFGQPLFRVTPA